MKKLILSLMTTLHIFSVLAETENRNEQIETEMKEIYAKISPDFFSPNIPQENKTEVDILVENISASLAKCYSRDTAACDELLIYFEGLDTLVRQKWIKRLQEAKDSFKLEIIAEHSKETNAHLNATKASLERFVHITKELSQLPS